MHTNFERAVIATNGRAPYNNKEVEVITKPEGFDPNEYKFQNNNMCYCTKLSVSWVMLDW